ncbi:hypothetical protein [Pseudovibrio exalbescens]|uniref:hypothetical protein n=1 Tax=Pseudovibrio exalbescens TaxID=197461 RepID=UPI000C9AECE6|nr:hypothetical protein [Pseudovibrio exalbescens]
MKWAAFLAAGAIAVMQPTGVEHSLILPSWQAPETRHRVIEFVERTARPETADYQSVDRRLVVIEADGLLWPEPKERNAALARTAELASYRDRVIERYLSEIHFSAVGGTDDTTATAMGELIDLMQRRDYRVLVLTREHPEVARFLLEEKYNLPRSSLIGPRLDLSFDQSAPRVRLTSLRPMKGMFGANGSTDYYLNEIYTREGQRPLVAIGRTETIRGFQRWMADALRPALTVELVPSETANDGPEDELLDECEGLRQEWARDGFGLGGSCRVSALLFDAGGVGAANRKRR